MYICIYIYIYVYVCIYISIYISSHGFDRTIITLVGAILDFWPVVDIL